MAKYKVGDKVISRPTSDSVGCAPEGTICLIQEVSPSQVVGKVLYDVALPGSGIFYHYEDELEPAPRDCDYCQKGKTLTYMNFGETAIKTYILGNLLYTEAHDHQYNDEDSTAIKIKVCPVCGIDVHKEPDEEMEEIEEEE